MTIVENNILMWIGIYVVVGFVIGAFLFGNDDPNGDRCWVVPACILWPITIIMLLGYWILYPIYWLGCKCRENSDETN